MLKNYVYRSKSNMTILKLLNEILFHTLINKTLQKVCQFTKVKIQKNYFFWHNFEIEHNVIYKFIWHKIFQV